MSLFGAPAATSSAPSFSFGTPSTSAAPAATSTTTTPSLFGAPAASAAPATGGLFGSTAAKPAAPSLFGASATPAAAPAAAGAGGLFGAGAAAAGTSKPAFSFGTPAAAPSTTPAAGGGLFGSTATPAPAAGGGGLFGSTAPAAGGAAGGGLFGGLGGGAATQPAAGGGLFGSTAAAAAPAPAAPAAATAPAGGINKNTKFNDLPDAARTVIEEMDKFIRQQCALADELQQKDLGEEIEQTRRTFQGVAADASTLTSLLSSTQLSLWHLRSTLESSLSDLTKTTTLIEGFKGTKPPAEAKAVAGFPYEYFRRKTDEMSERVGRYKGSMEQISSLLSSQSSHPHGLSPSSLLPTLKAQHASLLSLASSVAALNEELRELKDEYRGIWREKTGKGGDPFPPPMRGNGVGGVERGVAGMAVR
ncbi:hypothetical protein JCM8547_004097 [Rhodosporidiobolus lusitaniae]